MGECKDCIYYEKRFTYEGTGYCTLERDYTKDYYSCPDWTDEEEE